MPLCLGFLALVTVLNLRGLGDTARAFLLPTMVFIVGVLGIIVVGLVHPLALHAPPLGRPTAATGGLEAVGILLVLRAFAAGCSALTGVEAIANGVPAVPRAPPGPGQAHRGHAGADPGRHARSDSPSLAVRFHIQPRSGQTALSQIMGEAVGRHFAYYFVSLAITVALALAANTSFGGLPVLASLLARDDYLPHIFTVRGDRQNYSTRDRGPGAVLQRSLLVAVNGATQRLIPMFAIGVFTGFTLSQIGLVVHWYRTRPPRWRRRAAINGVGALGHRGVHGHLPRHEVHRRGVGRRRGRRRLHHPVPPHPPLLRRGSAELLGFATLPAQAAPRPRGSFVIVPVTTVSTLTARALSEALSIGHEVLAVTVAFADDGDEARGPEPAVGRVGPGRAAAGPAHRLCVGRRSPSWPSSTRNGARDDDQIVVLIPVVVPTRVRYRLLHNHLEVVAVGGADEPAPTSSWPACPCRSTPTAPFDDQTERVATRSGA